MGIKLYLLSLALACVGDNLRGVSGRHQFLVCHMKGVLVRTQGYIIIALMSGLFLQTRSHGYIVHQHLLSSVHAGCQVLCITSKQIDSRTGGSLIAMMIVVVQAW